MDLDHISNKISSFYNLSRNKNIFITTIVSGAIFTSISNYLIGKLPKPETFLELGKYLLSNTDDYMLTLICSLIAGLLCFHNGITLIIQAINLYEDYTVIVYGLTGIAGLLIFIAGFYYLNYLVSLTMIFLFLVFVFFTFMYIMSQ
ncbi:MAG: hypothetical protein N4A57_02650 [Anaeromicrobium sp.]|uniref:hypothetical protein n=1 Tax=Anaeromicrobium sp. TaxID=1929132 RepID=UPI0025DEFA02|nr:hypothetical protein [Anaeromicrobium sp.]MCT4593160.1 hypothetical protein [Anaeromicrobium sp.]